MKAKIKLMSIAIVLLVGASTPSILSHQAKAATSGLAGYWKFDEGSGTVASDSSNNGNTGTLVNGPQWVDGIRGNALTFDGVDDYVDVLDSNNLDVSQSITIEAWVKPHVNDRLMNIVAKWAPAQRSYIVNFVFIQPIKHQRKEQILQK
jgi:hypothetical protein